MGSCSPLFVLAVVLIGIPFGINEAKLAYDYYKYSCPNLETIVKREMLSIFLTDATAPAAFLRLMFHDCQVQGCDASILLDSDNSKHKPEMVSSKNFAIRKRETIGYIKSILENECPGKVSCADIIGLAAKESVSFSGGPHIQIPLGRKDSTTSSYQQADASLPPQGIKVHELIHTFASKGMNLEESIAIIGAHTLGVGHCINIASRLYDPQPNGHMHYGYKAFLRLKCPTRVPLSNFTFVPNDITPTIFDNQYYRDVLMGKGLFTIDSSISTDPRTAPIVRHFAIDQNYFFQVFSSAFVKLSSTNVLTKGKGEVRMKCSRININ
ncbi:hypothetical protein RGQ29_019432 [Quercus rubra]|uniref:Peroxidase n=1 Tax=Quercus rubra TaxID=3512 RepID=A0AAN7IWB1_QUERU|nr:hypothetical protein RGQ29_019432 [Quercus rubra]